jgi:hypothetical protein
MIRAALLGAALMSFLGCGPEAALWLEVEAPLRVPDECDAIEIEVRREDGATIAAQRLFTLQSGPAFPLTLALPTSNPENVGAPLSLRVRALKDAQLARPWAESTTSVTLRDGELNPIVVRLCDCP